MQQRGGGDFTLCERCNNNTGAWYGAEYAAWAKQGFERLLRIPTTTEDAFFIPFRGRPLRFLKQVLTMFFSVNSDTFADQHHDLVRFVLNRQTTGLSSAYNVDLVLVRGGFARSAGAFGVADLQSGTTQIASEVAHAPFAFRLLLGGVKSQRHGAIEHLARYGYNDEAEVWLHTIAGHVATKYPGDYRSLERVDRDAGR